MTKTKFVTITATENKNFLIGFWPLEKKNLLIFSTTNLIDKANNLENLYYKIGNDLKEFNNDRVQLKRTIRESSLENSEQQTTEQQTGNGATSQQ